MTPADTSRAGVEQELCDAMLTGRLLDLRAGDYASDTAHGASWDRQRTVPAALLAELLTSTEGSRRPKVLRLVGARIIGQLDLEATELVCPFVLSECWFAEPVVLREAQALALRLPGCHMPGLSADSLTTRGDLHLRYGFTVTSEIRLSGAHIGGQLDFSGANLFNSNGIALNADGLTVEQDIHFGNRFTASGEVRLSSAHIGGQLSFVGATFAKPGNQKLNLQETQVRTLLLRDLTEPPQVVDFSGAQVGTLLDDPASWPRQAVVDRFVYDALFEYPPVSVRRRLDWLASNPRGYSPQPYEQLAAVYRRAGRDQDARTVAIARQRVRRRTLSLPGRLWSVLLDGLVGYGYRTWMAGLWLLGFWLVGTIVFAVAHGAELLTAAKAARELQHFNPVVYALDVLLPIVNLGQDGGWVPHRWAAVCYWLLTLAGWVLTTAVVAALSGLLKRE
jgi:hypothetical protein